MSLENGSDVNDDGDLRSREAALEMSSIEFRKLGHNLVDQIADFLESLPSRSVNPNESPAEVREALGASNLPEQGTSPEVILDEAAR